MRTGSLSILALALSIIAFGGCGGSDNDPPTNLGVGGSDISSVSSSTTTSEVSGGAAQTGGTSTAMAPTTGGTPSTGGTTSSAATAGGAGAGGTSASDTMSTGGVAIGGTSASDAKSTGGVATGGTSASDTMSTGGVATGGTSALDTMSTGGAATGGTSASDTMSTGGVAAGGATVNGNCLDSVGDDGGVSACCRLADYDGSLRDASFAIQDCIDRTPDGSTLALPPGRFRIARQVVVARPISVTTRGKVETDPPCDVDNVARDCFEVVADVNFLINNADQPGLLWVPPSAAGASFDHLVFNGNNAERWSSTSAAYCTGDGGPVQNTYGYNVTLAADRIRLLNSVSRNALCGTGMEVDGKFNMTIVNNRFVNNGVHDCFPLFADGLTVTDVVDSVITGNLAADNSDIDIILGGGRGSIVRDNLIQHSDSYASSSYAALMLTVWSPPTVPSSSGDFTGADIAGNRIDCSAGKRCGFGFNIGTDAWMPDGPLFGGAVHDNVISNAQQGLNVAHTSDIMHLYDNVVTGSGGEFVTGCGLRMLSAYNISTASIVDRSGDHTPDESYTHDDWSGCLPNI